MNYTTNYRLRQPEPSDNYTVDDANENARIVDEELKKRATLDESGKVPVNQIPALNYDSAGAASNVQQYLTAHINDHNNPHHVTAEQVGADPSGSASTVQANLTSHINNKSNPHNVTAKQVGTYSSTEIMASTIPALYGLSASAVPSDIMKKLADAALVKNIGSVLPKSAYWYGVTYGNNRFVAIAYTSLIAAYSDDGVNWIQTSLPASRSWKAVVYGKDRFIAIAAYSSSAAYSYDGVKWNGFSLGYSKNWSSIAYSEELGRFVIVGNSTDMALVSEDGKSWQASTLPESGNWDAVVWGNGKFVAVRPDTNTCAYSTDGVVWKSSTLPLTASWSCIAFGNGMFVAIANGTNYCAYSKDGINWTKAAIGMSGAWEEITFGDGKFVAVMSNDVLSAVTTDGETWELSTTGIEKKTRYALTYGNKRFLSVPYSGANVSTSFDGLLWNIESPSINKPDGTPLIAAMQSILGLPGIQIETGEYIGTGSYGYQNPTVITCSFYFKIAIVYALTVNNDTSGLNPNGSPSGWVDSLMYVDGQTLARINDRTNEIKRVGNTLSFGIQTGNDPAEQLNESGETYRYIFIG